MPSLFKNSELKDLVEKVESGIRLELNDGVRLLKSNDILALGHMANTIRLRKSGNYAYYIINRYLNHSNLFSNIDMPSKNQVSADNTVTLPRSLETIEKVVGEYSKQDISEIQIVDIDLAFNWPFDYYIEMLKRIKAVLPDTQINAFTSVHIDYFATNTGLSVNQVLKELIKAGLNSLSNQGEEVYSSRVLDIHRAAHELGMKTNATMLYGRNETNEEWVEHLLKLRSLQDQTRGFISFIPLPFYSASTNLDGGMGFAGTTGFSDLKILTTSRILLDNVDHIKAFWIILGSKLAQVSLEFGVDDLEGTVIEGQITTSEGSAIEQIMTKHELMKMIEKSGRTPVERDSFYKIKK